MSEKCKGLQLMIIQCLNNPVNIKQASIFTKPPRFYCSGGGYILTRDVIYMIQQLPTTYFQAPFEPEDAFTGYLVTMVTSHLGYQVTREINMKLKLRRFYECGRFKKWFYHGASTPELHVQLHDRIKRNDWEPNCVARVAS